MIGNHKLGHHEISLSPGKGEMSLLVASLLIFSGSLALEKRSHLAYASAYGTVYLRDSL
jgi:hypothetical protein